MVLYRGVITREHDGFTPARESRRRLTRADTFVPTSKVELQLGF